jgi:hypothetical protein
MNPTPLFLIQFAWFLVAWTAIAVLLVAPLTQRLDREDALSVWMAPQLFRVLGIGLLVPNLSPEMPRSFGLPTAIGDSCTAVLALTSLIALRRRWQLGSSIAWTCNLVGAADLAIALPHAATIQAARFLGPQWYVPALGVPLMIVSHVMAFRVLLRHPR